MAENSKIEWCHNTFNPWIGCTKVSEGCAHCYAEQSTRARVLRHHGQETWGKGAQRSRTSDANWKEPLKWERDAAAAWENWTTAVSAAAGDSGPMPERPRVFCASLADWLDDEVPMEWLYDLLDLIQRTPNLDWLLLTKRPENWRSQLIKYREGHWSDRADDFIDSWLDGHAPANVWIGTTVENQARADERIPQLLSIPAVVRFLSCEPLLGPVDITTPLLAAKYKACEGRTADILSGSLPKFPWLDWVICGGESGGPKARPMHPDWARSLRDQCSAAGVPFFFKQWGDWAISSDHCDGSANANDLDRAGMDPGAAVYFPIDGVTTCIAIDRYDRIWKNLRAIQRTLEAFHLIERHGGSGLLKQAFTGFAALPAPGDVKARTCWEVLGIAPTTSQSAIDSAWRERAKSCHPDRPGGSHDAMTELNTARDQASQQATQP